MPKQSNDAASSKNILSVGGNETIGKLVQLSRLRNEKDRLSGQSRGIYFDSKEADRAVGFFRYLRHSKGEWAGQEFALKPWQEHDIIRPLFGWKRADGTRRFRTAYVSVGRKNGKSTLAAGIGLYLTIFDREPGAEVYSAATKRDQARITHSEAVRMVKSSRALRKWVQCFRDNISVVRSASKYEPLGADADTLDGLNTHGAIIDELHAHKSRDLWDVMETSTAARRQPMILAITTAGYSRNTVCWEIHDRAVKVLEGALADDSFFAYIAGLDKGDDWRHQAVWPKANPNLGVSVKLDSLLEQAQKAQDSPAFQNAFRRLRLNEWTEQADRFIDMQAWLACAGDVNEADLHGQDCYGGLDLASTVDLTACCLVFPLEREGRRIYKALWRFWLPAESIAVRSRRDRADYVLWSGRGLIKLTPGNVVDYDVVRSDIGLLRRQFKIRELAYDPWNATEIAVKLQSEGVPMVEFRQGFKSMSEPTKSLLGLIIDNRLEHGSNPVATWMASNLTVTQDPAGNLKPDKAKSIEKIDGMVALIMAIGRAILRTRARSVYETRDPIIIG